MVEISKLDKDKKGKTVDPSHYHEYQLADIFTKALGRERIEFLINKLGMQSFTPETMKQLTDEVDKTMDMTIDQQVALDEALVPHASRLRIRKGNFRLISDITSKESTLQVVYDVLKLTSFYKAFLVITDVSEIYMQEFWATATVHHHSIRFKMNNKKLINNCLSGNSIGYDSLRLSQAQILWGMYHKKNVDFAYLLWEDFMYQVEHKDVKKSNEMYYSRFPKNTQQFGAILPIELTNEDIRNSATFKEYYAIASGEEPPKTKASAGRRKVDKPAKGKQPAKSSTAKGLTVLSEVALTEAERMKLATKKSLTQTHISQASGFGVDEGTGLIPGVPDVQTYESDEEISWKSSDEDDDDDDVTQSEHDEDIDDQSDDESHDDQEDDDDQDDEDDDQTDSDNDGDDFIHPKFSTHDEEAKDEESFDPIVQTPSHMENSDDEGNDDASHGMNVGVTRDRMQRMTIMNFQLQSDKLRDEAQTENEEFLNKLDENIQKIIKEQVKKQVKVQVSKILPKIKKTVNEQLEAEVLTRASNSSKTSYVVAADLSELELKKILIEKMESNKCRDDEDKDEEPSAGSDQRFKRRRAGKEPESTNALKEKASKTFGKSTEGIITVTELQIVKWNHYKHLGWITVRRDDDTLYKFKEGDLKRLRIQDIEDMLLLLVQGKLTNLTVEERFAINFSLRMFTRSIVIQRRVEDLQLGVESYQKKLNLTKPNTYRSDLKCKESYTTYSNPRGFIYQNKNKQNRLMRIDELHKFSDGTLNDVLTALDNRLKEIWMKYLPQTICKRSDKERAAAMIQDIDKQLKTKRIIRSLEKFVGGRLYEGDFRMIQRTI
nr:hypothetical protein [Tanacetum cinerariifolium]